MKLKDFKDKPVQYQEVIDICRRKGIPVNDETDISDLIGQVNSFNCAVNGIAAGGNKSRGK